MDHAPQFSMLGEFRVEAVLGQGGSGIVYDATWGPRRVALKVLHPSLVGTGKERSQFLAEAQRLQQITHPSVVKVFAAGELPDGRPYLAMERLEGETLASVVAQGALPLDRALSMFGELCSAVAALHAQSLIHRDLKPENVFVVANKHAVLLDFGIAKDLTAPASTTTQEGNVRGTPAYMAPERFFGQAASVATDVYELAVTLYVMLAGRLPWDDVADPETRLSPRSLLDLAPGVPDALDIELRRALSTRVQNRPASATALLEAVNAAASAASNDEPSAASTARLRSGAHETVAPDKQPVRATTASTSPVHGPQRTPSAEHPTPLAWAPTVAASAASAPTSRRARLPLVLGLGAVAIAGGLVAWWRLRDDPRTLASARGDAGAQFSNYDPWGDNPPPRIATAAADVGSGSDAPREIATEIAPRADETKAFTLSDKKLTAEQYRAEAAAAIQKLPGDTRFITGVQLVDLRANARTAEMLNKFIAHPKFAPLTGMLPGCVRAVVRDAEWFLFGAPGVDNSHSGTFIVRGRWQRADVEACFAAETDKPHVTRDGAKVYRVGDTGWLDFVDDHTAYVTLNTKLDGDAIHKLLKKPAGPVPRVKELLAGLPAQRSLLFVGDGKAGDDWSTLSLPKGSDIFGWMLVTKDGVNVDLAADPHDEKAAQGAVDAIKPQIDEVFGEANSDAVGTMAVTRDKSIVRIKGNLTSFMLGIVTSALEP